MVLRPQVVVGGFSHPTCASCDVRPNSKTYLDQQTRWIVRTTYCSDTLVDFSVGLQIELPEAWTQVTRYSVAHANFHQYLPGDRRHEYWPIDSLRDMHRAYTMAIHQGFDQTDLWLADWRRVS